MMSKWHIYASDNPAESALGVDKKAKCANKHTPAPRGYIARYEWAQKMSKTHTQITCPDCGLYTIWLPHAEARAELDRRQAALIEQDRKCREEAALQIAAKRKAEARP
jgi:predicted RNA-binding Zn-ribbon protein involved in translation (DUF1610 family)